MYQSQRFHLSRRQGLTEGWAG